MTWIIIIGVIIFISILALPRVLKSVITHSLQSIDGYTGRIDNLQMNLLAGKITLQNIRINKRETLDQDPFALFPMITINFRWKPLFRKILDLNIVLDKPQLYYLVEKTFTSDEPPNTSNELPNLKYSIEKLIAFRINAEVQAGEIRYINPTSTPKLDIKATELNLTMRDFSNRASITNLSRITGTCILYDGTATLDVTLLPLEPTLTADLNLELNSINLVLLNDLFRTYAKVDIHKGTLNLYSEVTITNNSFKGYIKPLLNNLDFISAADRSDNIIQKIWERTVASFYNLIENKRNQVATKIPIEGRLDDPKVRVGIAILGVLRNAFMKAFTPSFDNLFTIRSVWNSAFKRYRKKKNMQKIERCSMSLQSVNNNPGYLFP